MKYVDNFLADVKIGIIPENPPLEGLDIFPSSSDFYLNAFQAREECTRRGMWAIVDKKWTKQLSKWIDNRKCLEVMSGGGWLAKALSFYGVDIIATDSFVWKNKQHKEMLNIYPIEEIDGLEAVKKYKDRDILIVSWPPYTDETICKICEKWGNNKPIVYIGEEDGGCCAPESFWKRFKETDDYLDIEIPRWCGVHDYLRIGYWGKAKEK